MKLSIPLGSVVGAKRFIGFPVLSITNLVKFHLILPPNKPLNSDLRYLKMGCASLPLTSILANMGKVTP